MIYAELDQSQTPNPVVAVTSTDDQALIAGADNFIDVTSVTPQPAVGWTYDPVARTFSEPVALTNRAALLSKAQAAIQTNATYLALAAPTAAQSQAQVAALTRQVNALIRIVAQLLDSTSGT